MNSRRLWQCIRVFLKSPERVEALVFLMIIALTAYFLLQRIYRQSVPADASVRERRTTTQTLLGAFCQLHADHPADPSGPRSPAHATQHATTTNPCNV